MIGKVDDYLSLKGPSLSAEGLLSAEKKEYYTTRPEFVFIKRVAISKLFDHLEENLSMFLRGIVCLKFEHESVKTPHNLFGWSKQDFLARRKMNTMTWVDIFTLQLSKACLETRKLQIDIKELLKLIKLLCDDYKGLETNFGTCLRSAIEFLTVCDELEKELEANSDKKVQLELQYFAQTMHGEQQDDRILRINELEFTIFESDVYDPIPLRYQIRYYQLMVEQFEDKQAMKQDAIRKQIENIEDQKRKELYCSQCTVDALYAETNKFRSGIEVMTARYAIENDDVENEISYKRAYMEKMRAQRHYLEEQMHRFKEEIAHLHLMETKEAELLKRKLEDKRSAAAAKLLAATKKKRKQKKKK